VEVEKLPTWWSEVRSEESMTADATDGPFAVVESVS